MYIDSPNISGSLNITGSILLNGTAVTASGGGSGGSGAGFPFSGSAVITGSLYVSGGNLSGSFAGDGAGLTGLTINQFATVNDTFTNAPSHSVVHNFGTKDVFVQVFESDDTLLIPQTVTTTNTNQVDIVFGDVLSGRVVIGRAGHILQNTGNFVSSSTTVATFSNAMSASISHNFDSLNIITQVYDSNNNVIVPSNIKNTNNNQTLITFSTPRSGKAVIAKAGHIVSGTAAVSASLATTAERVRAGSSGSRPTDYVNIETGSLWYNTDTLALEAFTGVSGSEWQSIGSASISQPPTPAYNIEYLVIAGGGGGGSNSNSGAGGAGGYISSSLADVASGATFTISVGAGGTISGNANGGSGNVSSIAGSSISTISTVGGGGGSRQGGTAGAGGSGGGGAYDTSGAAGTAGQGFTGGSGVQSGDYPGGGGGGASEAGNTDGNGTGGDGKASNITGASVTRAGGGSGGVSAGGTVRAAGDGGGGAGAEGDNTAPTAGDANTGGGGGGGAAGTYGTAGGSGVVILRMPTSGYSGTTSGSPTVTTSGTDTILTFTSSGTYTS